MKTNRMTRWFIGLGLLCVPLLFESCGGDDPAPEALSDVEYFGTTSPGDVWLVLFNNQRSTFVATWDAGTKANSSDDVVFSGPFAKINRGFIELTVSATSRTVPGIATNGSYKIYAQEIPGKSLIMLPDVPAAVNGAPRFGLVTMNARSTRVGTNGIHTFNYIRTAFPFQGYNHVDKDGCWGSFKWNINEAAGTLSLTEVPFSRTLTCVQNKINSSFGCIFQPDNTVPVNVTLGTVGPLGEFTQTANVGGDPGKKFTGQINIAEGLFIMDQGDGQGGAFMALQDASVTLSDFNLANFNQGGLSGELAGFGTFLGARNGTGGFTLSNQAYAVYNDPRLPNDFLSFHAYRGSIGNNEVESNITWAVKFEKVENGMLFGYLYQVTDNTTNPVTLAQQIYPVAAIGYKKGNRKMLVMVTGIKPDPTNSPNLADQWVFTLINRP